MPLRALNRFRMIVRGDRTVIEHHGEQILDVYDTTELDTEEPAIGTLSYSGHLVLEVWVDNLVVSEVKVLSR